MPYGIAALLDPATDQRVRETWAELSLAGIGSPNVDGGHRPHITLTLSDHIDLSELSDATARFAASASPIRLTLSSIGLFPTAESVLYYGVTVTRALLDLHTAISRVFAAYSRHPHAHFSAGTWVPHVSLGFGLTSEQLAGAITIAARAGLPLFGTTHELGLMYLSDDGQVSEPGSWRLGEPV